MPLYSIRAWGKFYGSYPFGSWVPGEYGYAIYQRRKVWHGILCIKERYYKSSNPYHVNCVIGQSKFRDAVSHWQSFTDDQKAIYDAYQHPQQMSGYNRFLHYYLRDLPY